MREISHEQEHFIQKCIRDGFGPMEMGQINIGFQYGLSIEQVKVYAKKDFNYQQMIIIRNAMNFGNLSIEQVSLFARPELHEDQMQYICKRLRKEPIEQVRARVALMILES